MFNTRYSVAIRYLPIVAIVFLLLATVAVSPHSGPQPVNAENDPGDAQSSLSQLNIGLIATGICVLDDLIITVIGGDGPFNVVADSSPFGTVLYTGVSLGVYTSSGPGTWVNVRVIEQSGDFETVVLGNFTCDTSAPDGLVASAVCNGPNIEITISAGDGPFNITASSGVGTPALGVGLGTTTVNGPEKWDNVTVTETSGDMENTILGQFKCRSQERPIPQSPAHRARTTNTNPTFMWTGITNANNYRIFIYDDISMAERTVDIRENSGGPTQHTLTTPLPEGRLFWRVRGRQNSVWSLWSMRYTLFRDPVTP